MKSQTQRTPSTSTQGAKSKSAGKQEPAKMPRDEEESLLEDESGEEDDGELDEDEE